MFGVLRGRTILFRGTGIFASPCFLRKQGIGEKSLSDPFSKLKLFLPLLVLVSLESATKKYGVVIILFYRIQLLLLECNQGAKITKNCSSSTSSSIHSLPSYYQQQRLLVPQNKNKTSTTCCSGQKLLRVSVPSFPQRTAHLDPDRPATGSEWDGSVAGTRFVRKSDLFLPKSEPH